MRPSPQARRRQPIAAGDLVLTTPGILHLDPFLVDQGVETVVQLAEADTQLLRQRPA